MTWNGWPLTFEGFRYDEDNRRWVAKTPFGQAVIDMRDVEACRSFGELKCLVRKTVRDVYEEHFKHYHAAFLHTIPVAQCVPKEFQP